MVRTHTKPKRAKPDSLPIIQMSNVFQRGMAWHTFRSLEGKFIDITRYVALSPENRATWSEEIAQQLLLVGSTVDSVFYEMRDSGFLPKTKSVTELAQTDQPKINNYREVYEPIFCLSGVEVQAAHGLTDYGVINPFEAFVRRESPEWWDAYNDVKHEFFQNVRKGTLHNLVSSLSALFVLNILHKDSQRYLARIGVIQMGQFDNRMLYWQNDERSWTHLRNSFIGAPANISWDVWATSEIFLHRFRHDSSTKA